MSKFCGRNCAIGNKNHRKIINIKKTIFYFLKFVPKSEQCNLNILISSKMS